MAFKTRKVPDVMVNALVAAWNAKQVADVAAFFHADTTQKTSGEYTALTVTNDTVTSANGTNDATNIVLINEMKGVINRHFSDTLAHDSAVSAQIATADATDGATAITLVNALKADYNTHRTASNVHFNNDSTNVVTNADATDTATTSTLANEIKGDVNAHITSAPTGSMIELIPA